MPRTAVLVLVAVLSVVLAACGGSSESEGGAQATPQPKPPSTAGLPAKLAANVKDADTIVGDGADAFRGRLGELRGHPVVVNQWASWCDNCRFEFPFFRSAATRYRDRVAFLGLDAQDDRGDAERFLQELPFGIPSVFDPDASVSASLGGGTSWPTTFFIDEKGEVVNVKIGAYANEELLNRDIEQFALGKRG